jgi:hypothetical protein
VSYFASAFQSMSRPVPHGPEVTRIAALPFRTLAEPQGGWEDKWRLAGCDNAECPYHRGLRPTQRTALYEAQRAGGLFAPMGVGTGKTLTSLLLPTVLGAQRTVLLIPPSLRAKTKADYAHLREHWVLPSPEALTIVAYSELSVAKGTDLLERLAPDLIVADEAHCLKDPKAARTKRFLRYFKAHPDTRFCALSGTMTSRSLRDWAHLSRLALRTGSPAPRDWRTLDSWAWALDDLKEPFENSPPGALAVFCPHGEPVREGYRRRVLGTPGVVATATTDCDASLVIQERRVKVPPSVREALDQLRTTWQRPDGEEFNSALEAYRYARQLASGLYLRWTEKPPQAWLEARQAWHREVRTFLSRRSTPGLDSPALYEAAVKAGRLPSTSYGPWKALEAEFSPETEDVWLSGFLVEDAVRWLAGTPGIVWTESPAFGQRLAKATGLRYYGAGAKASAAILEADPGESFVASVQAHGTGKHLAAWSRGLVVTANPKGEVWQQLLGRMHRQGQKADEVVFDVYLHTPELRAAFAEARKNSEFQGSAFGEPQRLEAATVLLSPTASHVPSAVDIQRNDC